MFYNRREFMADLTILFCKDASEWDSYLTQCLLQLTSPDTLSIRHENLEALQFPLSAHCVQQFLASKATLVIISPDFLDFVEGQASVFELGKLLKPTCTVSMLCGVRESDVSQIHKAALVSYDGWPRLQAKDQDKDFVLDVIKCTQEILIRNEETRALHKPKFKLTPRKVKMGNNKVYILLQQSMGLSEKAQVFLEGESFTEVPVKIRNPFTLHFVVPDSLLQTSRLMNVHVRIAQGPVLGVHPLKVESQMGELFTLLSSVNSPYELLCRTYGVSTCNEVDRIVAEDFAQRVPFGISLLENHSKLERKRSEEELPSLLHFAARYGLEKLTSQLLLCPGASQACLLRNSRGLAPIQLANQAGHAHISAILDDFLKQPSPKVEVGVKRNLSDRKQSTGPVKEQSYVNVLSNCEAGCGGAEDPYDTPSRKPVRVKLFSPTTPTEKPSGPDTDSFDSCPEEAGYMDMRILRVFGKEKLTPTEALLLELNTRGVEDTEDGRLDTGHREEILDVIVTDDNSEVPEESSSQKELIRIIERYKKGASISEVEKDFQIWQTNHKDSDMETSLIGLKEAFKGKGKKSNKKSSFSFPDFKYLVLSKFKKSEPSHLTMPSPAPSKKFVHMEKISSDIDNRPISTISTSSSASRASTSSSDRFSTLSFGSTYDSGNHSDSYEDVLKQKEMAKESLSSGGLQQHNPHHKVGGKVSLSLRPPEPPPRPNRPRQLDVRSVVPLPHSRDYYNDSSITTSPDYVAPDYQNYSTSSKPLHNLIKGLPPVSGGKWKSNSGDYYEVPALSGAVPFINIPSARSSECEVQADYASPSSIPLPRLPSPHRAQGHSDYYDIPRPGCLPVEMDSEKCDSIPEEMAPPPPIA